MGVALAPEESGDASHLMRAADMALYAAKDDGRGGGRFFSSEMSEHASRRQQIEQDLRVGISRDELEVYYQPIISFSKWRICCCEALVRWRHPTRLEAEITESALMSDADDVLSRLDELRKMGVRVALDEFGAGYSSLAYLSRFRPDKVKIDQSFVRDMGKNGVALAIIKAVRALARELNIDMLVEGVETQEQLEILRANGADEAQAFLFSKPRPAKEIVRIVSDPAQLPRARKLNNLADAAWTLPFERVDPNVAPNTEALN